MANACGFGKAKKKLKFGLVLGVVQQVLGAQTHKSYEKLGTEGGQQKRYQLCSHLWLLCRVGCHEGLCFWVRAKVVIQKVIIQRINDGDVVQEKTLR